MVRIASEYQEVEWIQGQYGYTKIDTGVKGNDDNLIISGKVSSDRWMQFYAFFGNYINENYNVTRLIYSNANDGGIITNINRKAGKSSVISCGFTPNVTHEFIIQKTTIMVDGVNYDYSGNLNGTENNTNIAFNANDINVNPTAATVPTNTWYYFKIQSGNTVLRNFIPCYNKSSGEIGMYDTVSNQFYTNSGTGTFLKGNDVTYYNINLLESRRRILLNTPHIETVSDTIAGFKTDVATKLKGCKIHFAPIQEGEGDPSPDNVRPISGWDVVKIYISKRNFLVADEITFTSGKYINGSGAVGNSAYYKISNIIPCSHLAGKTVSFNTIINSTSVTVTSVGFYKNETINTDNCVLCAHRESNSKAYSTVTVPSTANYMVICLNTSINLDGKYIVEGSTPPQEIDTPTTIIIPFSQTIYGGYVDLVKGEVVEEWGDIALDSLNWNLSTSSKRARYTYGNLYITPAAYNNVPQAIAEQYKAVSANYNVTNKTFAMTNGGVFVFYYEDKPPTGKLCAKLSTPNTYPIDPQTLKALRGMNNIWSDANGNVEVSFYTH